MDSTDAAKILEDCEKGLRRLVGAAATKGNYAEIVQFTSWAKTVGEFAQIARQGASLPPTVPVLNRALGSSSPERPASNSAKGRIRARSAKPPGYPKFFRTDRELIKIGWSKQERAEYHHKAPESVVTQLVTKLGSLGAAGRIFTTEEIFPLVSEVGEPIPGYQVYLSLAWLRHEGVVQAHGRQGYAVVSGENLGEAVTSHWNDLPKYSS